MAAHPDDEILGCGGTIIKLKENNEIQTVFLTNGVSSRSNKKTLISKRRNECMSLFKYKYKKTNFFKFSR